MVSRCFPFTKQVQGLLAYACLLEEVRIMEMGDSWQSLWSELRPEGPWWAGRGLSSPSFLPTSVVESLKRNSVIVSWEVCSTLSHALTVYSPFLAFGPSENLCSLVSSIFCFCCIFHPSSPRSWGSQIAPSSVLDWQVLAERQFSNLLSP